MFDSDLIIKVKAIVQHVLSNQCRKTAIRK